MDTYTADPTSVLPYPVDWSSWLNSGEVIVSSTWSVQDGISQDPDNDPSNTDTMTVIWLTGGTAQTLYKITNHIATSTGREHEVTFAVYVDDL